VNADAGLVGFYDEAYTRDREHAGLHSRWRAVGAAGKADHVIALCARAGLVPRTIADVGCGDGALLSELHRRGFGVRLSGFEITDAAAALARRREHIDSVATFDGERLEVADAAFDLGVLSHVLEHVPDPPALLTEVGRTCRAVVVEVPLEANVSARRTSRRAGAADVGHLHSFDRAAVRAVVASAGLRVAGEIEDALPRTVHRFFATTGAARMRADAKWAARASVARAAPPLARRLFTVHYACLCLPS
jgi:SAM-dependent methyltransferase